MYSCNSIHLSHVPSHPILWTSGTFQIHMSEVTFCFVIFIISDYNTIFGVIILLRNSWWDHFLYICIDHLDKKIIRNFSLSKQFWLEFKMGIFEVSK